MTGIIIPDYSIALAPQIEALSKTFPNVRLAVIVNPNSGSGTVPDVRFSTAIPLLQANGAKVLGYVYTRYGTRDPVAIKQEIQNYATWYKVDGINFDEFATSPGFESYYTDLVSFCSSLGLTMTVGNPGALTSQTYADIVDVLTIYESSGLPTLATLKAREFGFDTEDFGFLAHDCPTLDSATVQSLSGVVDWLYVTNDIEPNPWDTLPPYISDLFNLLNPVTPPVIPPVVPPPVSPPVIVPKTFSFTGMGTIS